MDLEFILNKALNKALCSKERIQHPNSNEIADFVSKFIKEEAIDFTDSSLTLPTREELISKAKEVVIKTKESKLIATNREITLGERAYINGGLWVLSKAVIV